jgi:selenocysteine lyase/cysteine desulfurase
MFEKNEPHMSVLPTPIERSAVPVSERWTYLNHAGVCPLPGPVADAMCRWVSGPGALGSLEFDAQLEHMEHVRGLASRLMGVPRSDVAFVKNTTEGLGFVANGLEWSEGDRVVVPDGEFPSTIYPWLALEERGVLVDRVKPLEPTGALPLEAFSEVINRGAAPKVVATSWVQFARGWRTDLAGLAAETHAVGGLLCVDVIQGLGVVPAELEAWGVDFAMADAHKWLLGPPGIGVLYVRGSCLERLRPLEPGWASVAHRQQWENLDLVFDDSARRLEGGSANACGIFGMGAGMALILDAGVDNVWHHVTTLCDHAQRQIEAAGYEMRSDRSDAARSGIVTFGLEARHDPVAVAGALERRGIVCSPRGGGIRISPHGYNTTEEIDLLVSCLGDL